MKLTKEVLVAYDVISNKSRKKIYDGLLDLGMYPIQKSVFLGDIKSAEEKMVKNLLKLYLNPETDKAIVINGQLYEQIKTNGIGYKCDDIDLFGVSYVL